MKYIKDHLRNNINRWKNKIWYHQRFDGSPYFLHLIAEAEIGTDKEKKNGKNFTVHYCFFENGKADWYILKDDMKRIANLIIEESSDKAISKTLMENWKHEEKSFYEKCQEIEQTNLGKLSDDELMRLHNDFVEITLRRNSSSSIIDGFALETDEIIAEKIREVYENSDIKNEMRFTELFSKLTSPTHISFINESEINLYEIALRIKKEIGKKDIREEDIKNIPKYYNLIKEHQKRYFWIHNNYVDSHILDVEYFIHEIMNILNENMESNLERIKSTAEKNREAKEELIKKLDIPKELKTLIEISDDFTYWQDIRKKATFWTIHYMSLILKEISKRTNYDLVLLKYMSPKEVSDIFKNPQEKSKLEMRKWKSVAYWDEEGHEILCGKEVDKIKDDLLANNDFSNVNDFRGLSAMTGKAIGKVKILKSAKDIHKVNEGDIIVAVMTRPDYVPAMKRAAGIVTNEGGVTSHAAIISRELGIPCIIGTKIATEVLKDNMIVEVNANHGWVKIIKR